TRLQGDWSSDVCSSDLAEAAVAQHRHVDLEQWRAAMGAGCRAAGKDGRRESRDARSGWYGACFPGRSAHRVAATRRRGLLLNGQIGRASWRERVVDVVD